MSKENVDLVRRASELLERRDWDGMTDLFDPDGLSAASPAT